MEKYPNILGAASTLLGICFVVITGLSIARANAQSRADEIAWLAAFLFLISIALSYNTIRMRALAWYSRVAEVAFLAGVAALTLAMVVMYIVVG